MKAARSTASAADGRLLSAYRFTLALEAINGIQRYQLI